jgi:hypothetical protein
MMAILKSTRTIAIRPDGPDDRLTLAALKGLVAQAEALDYSDESEVWVLPLFSVTKNQFSISVMEG